MQASPRLRSISDSPEAFSGPNSSSDSAATIYPQRGEWNRLFGLNRRVFKAYVLKESLEKLWDYHYEGAMLN